MNELTISIPPIWELIVFGCFGFFLPNLLWAAILGMVLATLFDPVIARKLGKYNNPHPHLQLIPETTKDSFFLNGTLLVAFCVGVILKVIL